MRPWPLFLNSGAISCETTMLNPPPTADARSSRETFNLTPLAAGFQSWALFCSPEFRLGQM